MLVLLSGNITLGSNNIKEREPMIKLSKEEIALIKKSNIPGYEPAGKELATICRLIDEAEALANELDEDWGDDLLLWYIDKYNEQQKANE